ncbi:unnamed protein product, partial [Brassica oleracea var. botrytis]
MEADQSSCNHRITESRLNSLSSVSLPSLYAPARFSESGEQGMESR